MTTDGKHTPLFLPYGRQHIWPEDIDAVSEVLRSDWLTQGPTIERLEQALAEVVGAEQVVACSSGTAALHLTMLVIGAGPGDTVITTPNTFLADANCARYVGADVRFADIESATGNMSVEALTGVLQKCRTRTIKAVIPVHFAGQPADLPRIHELAAECGTIIIDDACHALGACYEHGGQTHRVGSGSHSTMTVFSFHPVKHVAMGEGGAVATNDARLAKALRCFRNHGMTKEGFVLAEQAYAQSGNLNPWYYEMQQLGYNYRLTDIQAALGISQLRRLNWSIERRRQIAARYGELIESRFSPDILRPLETRLGVSHVYHLYVVRINFQKVRVSRATLMQKLREAGIGTQVHYIPVHLQPYYRDHAGSSRGDFPCAESYYDEALSLPMYPDLSNADCERVIRELGEIIEKGCRNAGR